jgi:PhnB protein
MSSHYKPESYPSVSPYLIVDGAARTIEFMKDVLDAVELRQFPDEQGKLRHAEVRIDDSVIMIADSAPGWPALSSHVHVYVRDVDATYRRALAAGGTSVQEPVKKDDEDRRGGIMDPSGTTFWISTRVG